MQEPVGDHAQGKKAGRLFKGCIFGSGYSFEAYNAKRHGKGTASPEMDEPFLQPSSRTGEVRVMGIDISFNQGMASFAHRPNGNGV